MAIGLWPVAICQGVSGKAVRTTQKAKRKQNIPVHRFSLVDLLF
jgi:hypothetical protein